MPKLVSEQRPNDGAYHIKRLVDEANGRLKQIGKHGKRASLKAKKTSLTIEFTFHDGNGKAQKNKGLGGIPVSANGILEAEKIAQMVTNQLTANSFTWDWFNSLIGKDTSEQNKQLTCKEMVEQYKKHYFKQRKESRTVDASWYINCRNIEKVLCHLEKPLSLHLIREVVECTENNSDARKTTLNGLANFLKYFDNTDYKDTIKDYKASNKIKRKPRNVPSDKKIVEVYKTGFEPNSRRGKRYYYRYPQWQFLFGLLATYGLRVHEAWNIANWDKPVVFRKGDWVTVDVNEDEEYSVQRDGEDLIVPAILDPNNKHHLLCIKHDTKTGYRTAMPLSPEGHNWVKEFNLLQPLNLPDLKNPLKRRGRNKISYACTDGTCQWFRRHEYGFTPHDLRHAYVHRGHRLNYNPKALADSAGHSIEMSSSTYVKHMSQAVKAQGMIAAMNKEQNKRSENELLKEEVAALQAQLEVKENENRRLKAELEMYKAIKK